MLLRMTTDFSRTVLSATWLQLETMYMSIPYASSIHGISALRLITPQGMCISMRKDSWVNLKLLVFHLAETDCWRRGMRASASNSPWRRSVVAAASCSRMARQRAPTFLLGPLSCCCCCPLPFGFF